MADFLSLRQLRSGAPHLALAVFAVLLSQHPGRTALTELVSLGSASYAIEPSVSIGAYTQNATGTTFSPSVALGDTVGGVFTAGPFDWSSFSDLNSHIYLKISFTGANPLLPMTLGLFNSDFSLSSNYQGTTDPIAAYRGYFKLDLVGSFLPEVLANAGGAQITWDGGADVNATLLAIASGPAPPPPVRGGSFTASAPGGVRFINNANVLTADPDAADSDYWVAATLSPKATAWSVTSDSNAKTDVAAVNHRETLRKVAGLPVPAWHYRHNPHRPHVGPMAQDFRAAFGLGRDDKHISTLDADGVALSALKGLIEELQERQQRSKALDKRLAAVEAELRTLRDKLQSKLPPAE